MCIESSHRRKNVNRLITFFYKHKWWDDYKLRHGFFIWYLLFCALTSYCLKEAISPWGVLRLTLHLGRAVSIPASNMYPKPTLLNVCISLSFFNRGRFRIQAMSSDEFSKTLCSITLLMDLDWVFYIHFLWEVVEISHPPSGVGFSWPGGLIVIERFLPWPLV